MSNHMRRHTQPYHNILPYAVLLCLLAIAGCKSPFSGVGEERTVVIRVSGSVSSTTDGSAIRGAAVTLGRIVGLVDTGDEILERTDTGENGHFSISKQVQCGAFTLLRVQAWSQGYSPVFKSVECSEGPQIIDFRLSPMSSGNHHGVD
jgi:hypothetical protein